MTREELKKNIRSLFYSSKTVEKYLEKAYTLIDQIYNDHETTIEILMKANEEEISRHFNECEKYEAKLKAKDEEIDRLKSYIEKLWQIVDDIDTYGDMAKSDDALFRSLVEKKQKERWKLPISTDGYSIYLKDNKWFDLGKLWSSQTLQLATLKLNILFLFSFVHIKRSLTDLTKKALDKFNLGMF